jgi:uncharacterized protein
MISGMANNHEQIISHIDLGMHLDFYGQLLTDHCRAVMDMHYGDDMSLGEIAENLGITRQAVHDRIRQGIRLLTGYENALGLVARYQAAQACIDEAIKAIDLGLVAQAREKLLQLAAQI